ncbi:alpha/beta hydrolase [Halodurantibacterium flavum]|uniref:Alpha/beta hydrolase n=1 Tax=Halodurantibacterium flavum TaxID=1382802 RepID=A0ABW4SAR2_9RHOB
MTIRRGGMPAETARLGLVLLHGRGGSAADMLGLPAQAGLQDLALVAPEAAGNSWWPVSFLAPHDALAPWLDRALADVDAAIGTLEAAGLTRDRIALAGFSQGACLALEYAARHGGLHSVFGFSGGLVGTGDAGGGAEPALYGYGEKRFDYAGRADGMPVWISCHARDPHIPLSRVERSAETFRAIGAEPETRIWPGAGHGLGREDLSAMARLLGPGSANATS